MLTKHQWVWLLTPSFLLLHLSKIYLFILQRVVLFEHRLHDKF